LEPGKVFDKVPTVKNPREAAAYTFGYNRCVFAQRVHDVLSVIAFVKNHERAPTNITLVGLGGVAGAWAAAARTQAGEVVDRAAIDTAGFRFLNVNDIYSPDFLPGGSKYGDVAAMVAIAAPKQLWLAGDYSESQSLLKSAYQAAGAPDHLVLYTGSADAATEAAVAWLIK
jgi:hypothetical protein